MAYPHRIRAYARFLGVSFQVNLQAAMEYRANFLLQVFGMMLNNGAFALFWAVLIDRTGGVGGYGFGDVMLIWALVSAAFGLAHILLGNIRSLGQIVMKGDLDTYLLQPKNVYLNVLASRTIVSAWGDFLYGLIVVALIPGFSLGRLGLFLGLSATGAVIVAAVFAAAESLVFYLGNSQALSSAVTEFLLSFSLYPETVFDSGMRWVFYTLLPSGFVAFLPRKILLGASPWLLGGLAGIAGIYLLGSYVLFMKGLKRYESGNQIGTRI